ncbi:MAG: hypothetical protein QUS66_15985, partial [Bacteroidota bacterium]|nr:hypothetical protein [Bacteroidota bacterium]
MKTVILANGTFPSHPVPLARLHETDMIICCDGAAGKLVAHGLEPGIIIGDLDSVPPACLLYTSPSPRDSAVYLVCRL